MKRETGSGTGVNFHLLRRTNTSLSRKAKVDDKVSPDQRGHGLGVSLSVYAISDLDQKIEVVTKLESDASNRKKTIDESGHIQTRFQREGERHSGGKVNAIPAARRTLFR